MGRLVGRMVAISRWAASVVAALILEWLLHADSSTLFMDYYHCDTSTAAFDHAHFITTQQRVKPGTHARALRRQCRMLPGSLEAQFEFTMHNT